MDKEREEQRKAFFLQQEKKLQTKQLLLRRRERKEEINKKKVLEERRMQREKNEIKWEAERERRRIQQLQREHTVSQYLLPKVMCMEYWLSKPFRKCCVVKASYDKMRWKTV